MESKIFNIIIISVLIVAGSVTLITSRMIAGGITDEVLCNKTFTVLVISGVLTLVALLCNAIRAIILLYKHSNK